MYNCTHEIHRNMVHNYKNNNTACVCKYVIIFQIRVQNILIWNSATTVNITEIQLFFTLGRNNNNLEIGFILRDMLGGVSPILCFPKDLRPRGHRDQCSWEEPETNFLLRSAGCGPRPAPLHLNLIRCLHYHNFLSYHNYIFWKWRGNWIMTEI